MKFMFSCFEPVGANSTNPKHCVASWQRSRSVMYIPRMLLSASVLAITSVSIASTLSYQCVEMAMMRFSRGNARLHSSSTWADLMSSAMRRSGLVFSYGRFDLDQCLGALWHTRNRYSGVFGDERLVAQH